MTERRDEPRRPALPRRSRKRWAVAGGIAAGWVVLLSVTGSATGATMTLAVLAIVGVLGVLGLRGLGVTRQHPWVQQLAARPWRDGQDVLQLALRHLPEVFVITPTGLQLAPNVVELGLSPGDLRSLSERIDIGLVGESAAEVYAEQVAAHGARFAGPGPAQVRVVADPSVAPGRYRLRQGQPVQTGAAAYPGPSAGPAFASADHGPAYPVLPPYVGAAPASPAPAYGGYEIHDGQTRAQRAEATGGTSTVMEARRDYVPLLRLLTGDMVTETRTSGARAGRGDVELRLPQIPTVSREHARFTFSGGQWWIANLGRNGLAVNGEPVAGESPLSSGDSIRWGARPDALRSLVEIPREAG